MNISGKNKFYMLSIVCLLSMLLGACSAREEKQALSENAPVADEESSSIGDADKITADTNETAEGTDPYMDFIMGNSTLISDIDRENCFRKGNRYSYDEIVQAFIDNDDTFGHELADAFYADIDCGRDGSREMCIWLQYGMTDRVNIYLILTDKEDGVHMAMTDTGYYRSQVTVNKYGCVQLGGSGGASVYYEEYSFVDGKGDYSFIYNCEYQMGLKDAIIPYYSLDYEKLPEEYELENYADDDDYVTCCSYSFMRYPSEEDEEKKTEYYGQCFYTLTDTEGADLTPPDWYAELYRDNKVKLLSQKEADQKIDDRLSDFGLDRQVLEAEEPEYISLSELGIGSYKGREEADSEELKESEGKYVYLTEPEEYYYQGDDHDGSDDIFPELTLVAEKENEIIDTDKWLEEKGIEEVSGEYSDGTYTYSFSGADGDNTILTIYDAEGSCLYTFDFSDFLYAEGYEGDEFVSRGLHYALIRDDILYVNYYHRTYADSCPMNAYILAIDMNTGLIKFKTGPLVSNSDNFVIAGDYIITGYGFTNEEDYISLINCYTGNEDGRIMVKNSPEYFALSGDMLYVRCYSYDLGYRINLTSGI